MSSVPLNSSRNSDSTASLGSPFQSPTAAESCGHELQKAYSMCISATKGSAVQKDSWGPACLWRAQKLSSRGAGAFKKCSCPASYCGTCPTTSDLSDPAGSRVAGDGLQHVLEDAGTQCGALRSASPPANVGTALAMLSWELPSYVELLPWLYTLCKEQSFCDCTIFIGNVHFRMHKVVLAPASLLFKSVLDSTDTISIDASVVTPEFPLLLEIMYNGKLPLRKHNFTKVISVADSLQMFDVAVSRKNLLRDLISSAQDSQEADSSGNQAEANYLPQSGRPDEERTFIILIQRVSPFPVEAEMEAGVSPPGELTVNHTWVHQDTMSSESRSPEDSGSGPDQPAQAECSGSMEQELAELPEGKGRSRDLAAESKSCKMDFFVSENVFSDAPSDAHAVLKRLQECREIDASQKEALAALAKAEDHSVFRKLLGKVKDAYTQDSDTWDAQPLDTQTLLSFLNLFQDTNPELRVALLEREQGSAEAPHIADEETLTARLLCCREELIWSVAQLSPIREFWSSRRGFLTTSEKQVALDCCEGSSQREATDNLIRKVDEEKNLKVKLLEAVKASFPGLQLLPDNLVARANISDGKGKWSPEDYRAKLLQYRENFVELLTDTQVLLQDISAAWSLAPAERDMNRLLHLCKQIQRGSDFTCLVLAVLEQQSLSVSAVWQLLMTLSHFPTAPFCIAKVADLSHDSARIMDHHLCLKISRAIDIRRLVFIWLEIWGSGAVRGDTVLSSSHSEEGKDEVFQAQDEFACLLTEGRGQKPGIRRKVNSESQFEVLDKDKDKAGGASAKEAKESQDKASSKSFVCKTCCKDCDKVFHFYCHLKVHMKGCQVAREKQIQHKECGEVKSTKNELEKHQLEVYRMVGMAKKKKKRKRLPMACDIGREFAHTSAHQGKQLSGLCYHNRTHHSDVFAAQNHCSSRFSSLRGSCCDKTFTSTAAHQKHIKAEHTDVKFHECESCMELLPMLALLRVKRDMETANSSLENEEEDLEKALPESGEPLSWVLQEAKMNPSSRKLTASGAGRRRDTETQFLLGFSHVCPAHCSSLCSQAGPGCRRPDSDSASPTASQLLCCLCCFMRALQSHITSQHFTQKIAPSWVTQTSQQGAAEHINSFDDAKLVTLPKSQVRQTGSEVVTVENLFDNSHSDV
ncbi:LOW QUALITY PROTEIN: zinc finger and BTB domain-containing protein 40 [Ammospiza maritima maritima]